MARYAKAIVAAVAAALAAAQTTIPMSTAAHGWVTVALAALATYGVYRVPNAPMKESPVGTD